MATPISEKEKQILGFIENKLEQEKWFVLTKEKIIRGFIDSEFSYDDIEEILEDLEKKKRISIENIGFKIYVTKSLLKETRTKLKGYSSPYNFFWFNIISFFIWVILLKNQKIFNLIKVDILGGGTDVYAVVLLGFLISILAIYLIKQILIFFFVKIQEKFPVLKEYLWLSYSYILLILISIVIYSFIRNLEEFSKIAVIVGFFSIIVIGGTAINALIYSIKNKKVK